MPVYEYTCGQCGHDFEQLTAMSDAGTKADCPSCGNHSGQRRLSVFAARQGMSQPSCEFADGGCGGCGDPSGPCSM